MPPKNAAKDAASPVTWAFYFGNNAIADHPREQRKVDESHGRAGFLQPTSRNTGVSPQIDFSH